MANRMSFEEEAEHLVKLNWKEVLSIQTSYIFPDPEQKVIRVVHLDSKTFPEEKVIPFKFGPDPREGLTHPMEIAIVPVDAPSKLDPPPGWGGWDDAVVLEKPVRRQKAS